MGFLAQPLGFNIGVNAPRVVVGNRAPLEGIRSHHRNISQDTMFARFRAKFTGNAITTPTEPIQDTRTQAEPRSQLPTSKQHLVVLVNGLVGSRYNWAVISDLLTTHLDPNSTHVYISTANEFTATYDGIDTCGERLAQEIQNLVSKNPNLERISVLGHSMGALLLRYALAELYRSSDSTIAGLKPSHFISLATPHLGCASDPGPAQVPLVSWMKIPKIIPFGLHRLPSALSAPFAATAFKKSGQQLFLLDRHQTKPPLLYRLSQDWPQEGKLYLSALGSFETRTVYANRSGDHLVGWANSSIRQVHELPKISVAKGCGVVREDPLEAAWAIKDRAGVEERGIKANLEPENAHTAQAIDILNAENPEDLVHREQVISNITNNTSDADIKNSTSTNNSADTIVNNSVSSASTSNSGDSSGDSLRLLPSSSRASGSRAGGPLGADATSREYIDDALESLQTLPWRRIDVCFAGASLPLLAHQHVQVQRKWANWAGLATAKHLALQFVAMEELRQQSNGEERTKNSSSGGKNAEEEAQVALPRETI